MAIPIGAKAPEVVNLVIEIRKGERNKYEVEKTTGLLMLDRVNMTMLGYPTDYGYIPETLCEDGDPLDGMLIIDESVPHGVVVPIRSIGVLYMVDTGEKDEKLICIAIGDPAKSHIKEVEDLGSDFKPMVEHFYSHYKDWKKDWKGVDVHFDGWGNSVAAKEVTLQSMQRHQDNS